MDLKEYQEHVFNICKPECYNDECLALSYLGVVGRLAVTILDRDTCNGFSDNEAMQGVRNIAMILFLQARLNGVDLFKLDKQLFMTKVNIFDLVYSYPLNRRFNILNKLCESLGYDFNECLELDFEELASRK